MRINPYPNPSEGRFTFDFANGKAHDLRIINVQGEEQKYFMDGNSVDIRHLSPGLYIIEFTDQTGRQSIQRLIKK